MTLQTYLLRVLGWDPTAQRIREGRVNPISASAQDFDFTARWQRQDAVCSVRGCKTRLDILARYYGQSASIAPTFQCVHGVYRTRADQQAKDQGGNQRGRSATRKDQHDNRKRCEPKSDDRSDAVLIDARKLQVALWPALLQLERVRLVTGDLQIGRSFRMMSLQGERAFVIQNRAAKIARPEISIAEIVKQSCAPLCCTNERLVTGDRFREMTLRILLVCLLKVCIWLSVRDRSKSESERKQNRERSIGRHPERSEAKSRDPAELPFGRATGFDSLTSRSLSLRPSRPCRGFPSCSILGSARNDG